MSAIWSLTRGKRTSRRQPISVAFAPGCLKTCTSQECAELFSLSSSLSSGRQHFWFSNLRNRDGISTRRLNVGVFTRPRPLTDLGSSPCHTVVDLAAKCHKVDGLCQERLGSAFQGFSPGIRVAVGGDHNNGDVGSCCLGLRQKLKTGHSRPVVCGKEQDQRCTRGITDQSKRAVWRLRKIQPSRTLRLNCWRNSASTSGSSSTTRISKLICLPQLCSWLPCAEE